MKTIKIYTKLIALIFSIFILFQGCTVYKSTTIQKAAQTESKVMVRSKSGETFRFIKVAYEDGKYYGLSNKKGVLYKMALDENSVNNIKEKDKTFSIILSIGIPIIILATALISMSNSFYPTSLGGSHK